MKTVYISHRFTGENPDELKKELEYICNFFEKKWYKTFLTYRDIINWEYRYLSDEETDLSFKWIDDSDIILFYVKSREKSEWLLIEYGYAMWLNKEKFVICKKWIETFFVKNMAQKYFEFEKLEDIEKFDI